MVALQEHAIRAARIGARTIALAQCTLQGSRDRAALATDRQRRAMLILNHLDDARVAAQPTRGLAGQERLPHLTDFDRIERRAGAKAARRNRDHHLKRRTLRPVAPQVALRHGHQRIGAAERLPGRGGTIA